MKNKILLALNLILITGIFLCTPSFAETTVTSVKGQAKYKTGNQWANLTAGMKLAQGTKISTGVNSTVLLNINGDEVTIKQMTMIKIEEATANATETNTTIGLKRGSINTRVSKLKTLKTSFKISTPVATSSVRGTWQDVTYGPGRGMIIKVLEGIILAENKLGTSNLIRGNLQFNQGSHSSTPGNIAANLIEAIKGGIIGNLTPEELAYIQSSSDLINTPQTEIPQIFGGGGTGNVTVVPVFP
jgi:hypothetical protein